MICDNHCVLCYIHLALLELVLDWAIYIAYIGLKRSSERAGDLMLSTIRRRESNKKGKTVSKSGDSEGCLTVIVVLLFVIIAIAAAAIKPLAGAPPYGPYRTFDATVNRLYVDHKGEGSHYMVGTDKGVFEVQHSWWAGVNNADEIYSRFREGKRFQITTKGNKFVGWYFQEYPYVTDASEIQPSKVER